jgi:PBP4 family serine-type D-alanyl-D-alanine carboxypeptidase
MAITYDPVSQLRKDINTILADSLFIPAHASIKVDAVDDGEVLYERDSKILMNPASIIKLFTSAAALSVLDTNYQFKTAVFADNNPSEGIIDGNIYLKGFGDPDLTISDLDSLAIDIRRLGVTLITRNIIVDDSYFDDDYWGAGWTWDDESDPDAPYINALSVNKDCVSITVSTDLNTIAVFLEPETDFVTIINKAAIIPDSIHLPLKIRHLFLNNVNTIIIEGGLANFSQVTQRLPIRCPEIYTGTLFKQSLLQAGVTVDGKIVKGIVSDGLFQIAQHIQPIEKIVTGMNKASDNLNAENVLKVLGAMQNGVPGSAKKGVTTVKCFLSNLGLDTTKLAIVDGSGISRYNLLSADQVVQFLTAIYKQPRIFPMFYNSLPIAGIDGTIGRRMTTYPAADNLRAKTGTLIGASCLSGYVQTRDGETLAFSIMMQNFTTSSYRYCQIQDRIGALLAGFSRKAFSK